MSSTAFCTLFDRGYLPQGLALLRSLERHAPGQLLWVLAMDAATGRLLNQLGHPQLKVLTLEECETPELAHARHHRSWGEYCWTLTPFLPQFVLDRDPTLSCVTYIDADCYLLGPVESLLSRFESSGADCMITPHAYTPKRDITATAGRYCVQFMPFRRSSTTLGILHWWQDRCLERCSAQLGAGPLGDQGYLDDWPERFGASVFVLDRPELTLAPWNIEHLWGKAQANLCLYHFQGFRLYRLGAWLLIRLSAGVALPPGSRRTLFDPYVADLLALIESLPSQSLPLRPVPSLFHDPRGTLLLLPRLLWLHWWLRWFKLPAVFRSRAGAAP
ncbi:MAG: hypothetical protein WCK64_03295 [Synechococcaceae cyanobacterium ELA445]